MHDLGTALIVIGLVFAVCTAALGPLPLGGMSYYDALSPEDRRRFLWDKAQDTEELRQHFYRKYGYSKRKVDAIFERAGRHPIILNKRGRPSR